MRPRGVTAVLVAAGTGERLGAGVPKGLVELAGEPLLVHGARALLTAASVDRIVVVTGPADCRRAREALDRAGLQGVTVCAGGSTRRESVSCGLAACPRGTRVVAVHDAARPLLTAALVDRTVGALVDPWSAVAPGLPVVDTLKLTGPHDAVLRTVDRRDLWAVQTPQVFGLGTLTRAHASDPGAVTDDLALVESAGARVRLVPGERRNFKITYREDLDLAEAVLFHQRRRGS